MQRDHHQKPEASAPQERWHAPQKAAIGIDFVGTFEELKVADQVADDERKKGGSADGHDELFADV